MSSKSSIISYITLILAILTIALVFYTVYFNLNRIYSILLLILNLVFNIMGRKINENEMNLKKEDKEELDKSLNEIKKLKKK